MKKIKRLVILSDYGLDDAVALLHLMDNGHIYSCLDILAVGGNTSAEVSLVNARKLLAAYGKNLKNVRLIDTRALVQEFAVLPDVHGGDGMGDLIAEVKSAPVPELEYFDWLKEDLSGSVLLSLGPCTVTKHILETKGDLPTVIMAGLTKAKPNYNGYEFNHYLDIPAFSYCTAKPHVVATLDTCRAPAFNLAERKREGTDLSLKERLINRAIDLAVARHPDNCYIYDFIAALYLTDPDIFETVEAVDPWGNKLSELHLKKSLENNVNLI